MQPVKVPESVCFRVTRFCNARCAFCLAPPDGEHASTEVLMDRIDWLLKNGVRVIHFCGGEPTIHPGIDRLIEHVHNNGRRTRLTTNGIVLREKLLSAFRRHGTDVKVSLHGDREFHNRIVGCDAFDSTTQNIRRLIAVGVRTWVQTTIVSGGEWVVDWAVKFCCEEGVRGLNILRFIPRGNGYGRRSEFELTFSARNSLQQLIRERRKAVSGRLFIRWLDFNCSPVPVVETDGTIVLEGASESADRLIGRIPALDKTGSHLHVLVEKVNNGVPGGLERSRIDHRPS